MKRKLLDVQRILKQYNPKYNWLFPKFLVRYLQKITHENYVNWFIEKYGHLDYKGFCRATIKEHNIELVVKGLENIPKTGGCILVSNHPLGAVDAMSIVNAVIEKRDDIRFIVNDILINIGPLKDMFVGVNKKHGVSKASVRAIDTLFESENMICMFPAGLVSRKKNGVIEDVEWKKTFVQKAIKHKKNVIPIWVSGSLSPFFYNFARIRKALGLKVNLEMLYLMNETMKQKNKKIIVKIGESIEYTNFTTSKNPKYWVDFVKEKVYSLKTNE